jgi:uncharacterized Tic20 family protein
MQPSEDERVLAALSHASIIANIVNLAGLIATGLIWTTQRERSTYVRAHALQALVYQGAVLLISLVLTLGWGACLGLSLLPAVIRPDLYRSSPPNTFWFALACMAVPIGFGILATLYGLYGAYRAYRGRPFRYPLAGRLARDLAPAAHPAAQVERTPAASVDAPLESADPATPARPATSAPIEAAERPSADEQS